ncbi:Hypothetical predicted protein, partial [Paramuricea clavata]
SGYVGIRNGSVQFGKFKLKIPIPVRSCEGDSLPVTRPTHILQEQKYPSQSPKYAKHQETIWVPIIALKKKCTVFDPATQPTASEIADEFKQLVAMSSEATNSNISSTVDRRGNREREAGDPSSVMLTLISRIPEKKTQKHNEEDAELQEVTVSCRTHISSTKDTNGLQSPLEASSSRK